MRQAHPACRSSDSTLSSFRTPRSLSQASFALDSAYAILGVSQLETGRIRSTLRVSDPPGPAAVLRRAFFWDG